MSGAKLPLRGITVFEAAARHSSFRDAALELSLTPSAVSHQIGLLEDLLGVVLFERGRGVTLSVEGASYARVIRPLLLQLQQATQDVARRHRRKGARDIVRIRTPPSLGSRWILPRVPQFLRDHPDIDLRVNAPFGNPNTDEADVVIAYGDAARWQGQANIFLRENSQPLCAPDLLASNQILVPADLLKQTLITTKFNALSWEDWFQHQRVDLDRMLLRPIQFDPSHLAIDAALRGLGFILESDILTGHDLAAGRLVAPFPQSGVETASYWIFPVRRPAAHSAVLAAHRWLVEQADAMAAA